MTDNQARVPHGVNFLRMKQIPLTQGKFALVDDEDYDDLIRHKWCAEKNKGTWYAMRRRKSGEPGTQAKVKMHRSILGLTDSSIKGDHRNGNGLDNTRANLRACSNAENARNRTLQSNSNTGYMGVYFHKASKKFRAAIKVDGRIIYIGSFGTPKDAAAARDAAAKIHHGEFARLNFPNQ